MRNLYETILSTAGVGKASFPIGDYPIGTIIDETYHYSMIIHEFYKVIGHKGKSTLIIKAVQKRWVDGDGWRGHVVPVEDEFNEREPEKTIRIKNGQLGGKHSHFSKWDGTPKYEDHLD